MITNQTMRRLEALEESIGTGDGAPPFDIELVFVEPVDGCFGGRITRVVKLSELTNARSEKG
jgi:hypothetical protein